MRFLKHAVLMAALLSGAVAMLAILSFRSVQSRGGLPAAAKAEGLIENLIQRVEALEKKSNVFGEGIQNSNPTCLTLSATPCSVASVTFQSNGGKVLILASYNFGGDFPNPDAIRANIKRNGTSLKATRLHATGVPSFYSAHGTLMFLDDLSTADDAAPYVYELTLSTELQVRSLPAEGGHIIAIPLGRPSAAIKP